MRRGAVADASRSRRGCVAEPSRMRRGAVADASRSRRGCVVEPSRMRRGAVADASWSRRGCVAEPSRMRRGAVADASLNRMAPNSSSHNGIRSDPSLPRTVLPLEVFPQRPCHRGFSMVSPQYIRYAAGSKEEKRAGGPLHGDTTAHSFGFCKGVGSGWEGMVLFWPDPPSAEGLAWPAPLSRPLHPPTFLETGGLAVPPAGAAPPAPCLGNGGVFAFHLGASGRFPTFPRLRRPLRN